MKIISVRGTTTGNAHKAICYEVNRNWFRNKIMHEYKEIDKVSELLAMAKIILIEDLDLSIHILSYRNQLDSFKDMDLYYAFFDILSTGISGSVRLTQESFHKECYNQRLLSSPKSFNINEIELRKGLTKDEIIGMIRRIKANAKISRDSFERLVESDLKQSIIGLFLKVFSKRISSLVFWDEKCVLGIMLDDYNTIPLKLNLNSYEQVKNLLKINF